MPLSPNTERVFGMYLRSSLRMSSARMKTILGLAVVPFTSPAALPQTPDTSSNASATASNNGTALRMSNTAAWRDRRENGDLIPPPRIKLGQQDNTFVGESISPKSVCLGLFRRVSRRARLPQGNDPRACGQRPGYCAGSIVPELELLGPEITRVHRGVLDFVSAGRDDLPYPLLPKRRDGMVSSQVLDGHSHQMFVVVGPQGVAAVAQKGTQHGPHPSSSFPSQGSLFTRGLWEVMYMKILSSGPPEARIS